MESEPTKILVADDHRALQNVLRFTLEREGFAVTVAKDGGEAWQQLQVEDFDLVVTDYQMPEMNGEELCRRMKQDDRLKDVPVLLLSAKGMELDLARFQRQLGVYAVIFKPFSPSAVVATIRACLQGTAGSV